MAAQLKGLFELCLSLGLISLLVRKGLYNFPKIDFFVVVVVLKK